MHFCNFFDVLPDGGFTSGAFHSGSEFPLFGMINTSIEANSFVGFFFPFVSLLSLHMGMLRCWDGEINRKIYPLD